jgi:hypothetical protein
MVAPEQRLNAGIYYRPRGVVTKLRAAWISGLLCGLMACDSGNNTGVSRTLAPAEASAASIRAEAHLSFLRAGDWDGAAGLAICQDDSSGPAAAQFLEHLYQACRPGPIAGSGSLAAIDHLAEPHRSRIGRRIRFSYRCDDLDGLEMRWHGDNWYRALDSCAAPHP